MARAWILTSAVCLVSLLIASAGFGARSVAECRMSQLGVSAGPYVSEATEQHTLALRLVNRGRQGCVLYGYPRVTFHDARGLIPFRIRHGGDQIIPARAPKPVNVRPGGAAFLLLNKNVCVSGSSRAAVTVELATSRVPGSGVASFRFPRTMPFPWDPGLLHARRRPWFDHHRVPVCADRTSGVERLSVVTTSREQA